jgi:hypothetical protein
MTCPHHVLPPPSPTSGLHVKPFLRSMKLTRGKCRDDIHHRPAIESMKSGKFYDDMVHKFVAAVSTSIPSDSKRIANHHKNFVYFDRRGLEEPFSTTIRNSKKSIKEDEGV